MSKDSNIKKITKDILELKKQTVENMIEIGKKLIEVKQQLPHGQFGKYLKEEVDFSARTANRYMKIVTEFSNKTTLSNLEPSKLILLLDVPKNHIDKFTKDNNLKNMSCRKIRENVKKLKKSIKKEKEEQKKKEKLKEAYKNINEFKEGQESKKSNYDEDGSYNPFKNYQTETDKIFEEFFKNFNNGQFNIPKTPLLDIAPEEKKTLKHFYIVLAKNFHPDRGGNEEEMKVLNKLKENWGI